MRPKLFTTITSYSMRGLVADISAGATVAMVALPLSLAIAIASGADPSVGLITAIVGGFVISFLGGSRVQIGGPTGAFIVVVFSVIAEHGYAGLVLATFMAGIILLIAGYLRFGRMIAYVPQAVVGGFTVGIGIVIATSQLVNFFGLTAENVPADFLPKIAALWAVRATLSIPTILIAVLTMVLIVFIRKGSPRIPGPILAVFVGSLLVFWMVLPVDTVFSTYGPLPNRLPFPKIPAISLTLFTELFPSAMVIAFLAGVESLLSAMVADSMIGGKHRPNAELVAQGYANIASSLFGGLPATGAIARTATNVQAGGRTPVAGLVHAAIILIIMMTVAPLAGFIAMPAMAGLLIIVAWNMSEPKKCLTYFSGPKSDLILFLMTMTLTVLVDLTVAIGVGVSFGLALRLRKRNIPQAKWTLPRR